MSIYSIAESFKNLFSKKYLCKAPFTNIYISGDGSVTPCCFNRTDIFGNIYETPLKKILTSSKIIEFRNSIKNKSFPGGCEICKKHVEQNNKSNSGITTYEKYKVQKNTLSVIEFELSYKCNLRCPMCRLNEDNLFVNEQRLENKKFLISEQIAPYIKNLKLMRFYGGEPFAIDDYYSIWEQVIKSNSKCKFLIQTNGTIFNSRIENIINKGHFSFNMSLDSLNKSTYETIRKGAIFEKSMQNLTKFQQIAKLNNQTTSISVCPMRINSFDIPNILEFCNKNNLFIFFNTVFSPWDMAIWSLPQNELIKIYKYYRTFKFSGSSKVKIINSQRWKSFLNQISNWIEKAKTRPILSSVEIENAKQQIYLLIISKTKNYISTRNIQIDYLQQQTKIYNALNEILNFVPVSTLVEKINLAEAEILFNKVIEKNEYEIKENIIIP